MSRAFKSLLIFFAFVAIYTLSRHAIGTSSPTTSTTTTVVSASTTTTATATACQGSDFSGVYNEGEGAAGTVTASVTLTKSTPGTCTVDGWPILTLLDRTGATVTSSSDDTSTNPVVQFPVPQANEAPTVVTVKDGANVSFFLAYSDVPVDNETTCPSVTTIEVQFAKGGSATPVTPQYPPQPCDGGRLYVSPLYQ